MNTARGKRVEHFARVPNVSIPRSKFDLSHGYKTTLDGGWLVPVMVTPMVPGDSFAINYKHLCRMTTPIVPFMDNVKISFFSFFVPNRLVWDNWEDYITGCHKGKLGTTHTTKPTITLNKADCASGTLPNYFGLNCIDQEGSIQVDALPFRSFQLVYDEWFRDENLIDPVEFDHGDTVTDKDVLLTMRKRGKRKDYFTSALPWVQKGPQVELPIGGVAPVTSWDGEKYRAFCLSSSPGREGQIVTPVVRTSSSSGAVGIRGSYDLPPSEGESTPSTTPSVTAFDTLAVADGSLYADLGEATATTINNLREAFAIQHLLERDARGGSRYVEALLSHWGVTSPDMRLQRPEYVGGYTADFMVNSVAQTSGSTQVSPQGNLAAIAKSASQGHVQYSAVEHGTFLTLAVVFTDLTYQQGINRNWFRFERMDEFFPEFAHLGEQPIFEKEIYARGDSDADNAIFGYQERFAEMRYFPSLITGKLNSMDPLSLDYWHLAQEFAGAPSLSKEFIEESPPFERVLAVQDEPQFVLDLWFDFKAIRPLPMFSVPSLLDHF